MDPFSAMLILGLVNAGASYFSRPEQPEPYPRGEYTGPSPESLAALQALQAYMRGGGATGTVQDRMFGANPTSPAARTGQSSGANAQANAQDIIRRMFGGVR